MSIRRFFLFPIILFAFAGLLTARNTPIPFFQWQRISEYQISNLVLSETGDLSLSPAISPLFQSDVPLWSATAWRNTVVVGTAEEASIVWIEGGTSARHAFPDHKIISALASDDSFIYAAAVPNTTLYLINHRRNIVQSHTISNAYIWSIVPSPQGVWVLAGEPAEIYLLQGNNLQSVATMPTERHLLKGVWTPDGLYCIGESSFLYKFSPESRRITAVAEFPDPIQDITAGDNNLFVGVNSTPPRNRRDNENAEPQEVSVYRYDWNGSVSRLFSLPRTRLQQMFFWQNRLYLGAIQNFFVYDVTSSDLTAMGYGQGGVKSFVVARDRLHLIADRPDRVFEITLQPASTGSLVTPVFDADQKSEWGKITDIDDKLSFLSFHTRSAINPLGTLWEDWSPYQRSGITSSPNRFLQARLTLSQRSTLSLREIYLPFAQINRAPEITRFDVLQRGERLLFLWEARDPNQDRLHYTLSAIRQRGPITVFSSPLTNNSLEISSRFFPEGSYRFLFTVDDVPSNLPQRSLQTSRRSSIISIDHTAPHIRNLRAVLIQRRLDCEWVVSDNSLVGQVWYSLAPHEWIPVLPTDGIYDSSQEEFQISLTNFQGGYIQIKARDVFGNESVHGQWVSP